MNNQYQIPKQGLKKLARNQAWIDQEHSSASVASDSPNQSNETRAVLRVGDKVSFDHYGERKTGVIAKLGKSLVFLTDGRWLHRQSVTSD